MRLVDVSAKETVEQLRQRVELRARHPVQGLLCDGKPLPISATLAEAGVSGFRSLSISCAGLAGGMRSAEDQGALACPIPLFTVVVLTDSCPDIMVF